MGGWGLPPSQGPGATSPSWDHGVGLCPIPWSQGGSVPPSWRPWVGAGAVPHFTPQKSHILMELLQCSALFGAEEDGSGRFGGFWLKMNPWDVGEDPCGVAGRGCRETEAQPESIDSVPPPAACRALLLFGAISGFLMPRDVELEPGWWKRRTREFGLGDSGKPSQDVGACSFSVQLPEGFVLEDPSRRNGL